MNKFEQLASQSNLLFAILGDPALDKFEVLVVSSGSLAQITSRENFVGLVGCSGIRFRCELAVELDDPSISALAQVFINLVERAITHLEAEFSHKHRRHNWSELT